MKLVRSLACIAILLLTMHSAVAAEWTQTKTHEGIVYFLYDSPASIKRFDLNSEVFLDELTFTTTDDATAFAVDASGLYMAFGRNITRFDLDGENPVSLANTSFDITEIVTSDLNVYAYYSSYLTSIAKSDNSVVETYDFFYSMKGLSFSKLQKRLFARNLGVSPSDILYLDLPDDGTLPTNQKDSPYHGDYPSANRTFLFPNEARIVDDAGIIYATSNLSYVGSLAGAFTDLSFYGDLPIVLRDNKLVAYSNSMLETGSFDYMDSSVRRITVHGESIFGFYTDTDLNLSVIKTSIDLLSPDEPGQPIDPVGLIYTPDSYAVDDSGVAYILSKAHLSVFRWSLIEQRYLSTIPLLNVPNFMALSKENNALYIAYESGAINVISLDGKYSEAAFANLPQRSLGLATAGEYVFAVDPSGAWESHFTFDKSGVLLSQKEWNHVSAEFIWNPTNRKMYHFRDGTSPNDLIWEDIDEQGVLGENQDSPYHSSSGIKFPIRVAPDGSVVVLGSGRVYDAISLSQVNSLSNDIDDAVWNAGKLFTLKELTSDTTLQQWDPSLNYVRESEKTVDGQPLRLLQSTIAGKHWLTAVSSIAGVPHFYPVDMGDDLDLDGDNVENLFDNCVYVANADQVDDDDNGIGNACELDFDNDGYENEADNCPTIPNPTQLNTDMDELGDVCDEDDDADMVLDKFDCSPLDSLRFQLLLGYGDGDADGHGDGEPALVCSGHELPNEFYEAASDNCPSIPNADQLDTDKDLSGDACDLDDDNDSVEDLVDNCPLVKNKNQVDFDADLVGDVCDNDQDNDGVLNGGDTNPLNPFICQDADSDSCDDCSIGDDGIGSNPDFFPNNDGRDTDSNGICDITDTDDDNDSILDVDDNCPLVVNPDQLDSNNDGVGDACKGSEGLCFPVKSQNGVIVVCI